jgi:acyl-CoA oxidase
MSRETLIPVAITLVVLRIIRSVTAWLKVPEGRVQKATLTLLTGSSAPKDTVPPECLPVVSALELAAADVTEKECASQMRAIVTSLSLKYETLVASPETLLRCSTGLAGSNGALWTRFTVQYNLYAGSIIALGSDEQRAELIRTQKEGDLGCFAFTEKGAGVLSGAGMETTATFDRARDVFVIHSPTPSSAKNWISQGCFAQKAVILAELILDGKSMGGHLFWATIASAAPVPVPVPGVCIKSLSTKVTMSGLDNAEISFENFVVPRKALLSRFGGLSLDSPGQATYVPNLPKGVGKMLDLLVSRLLTGRIVLSEASLSHALSRVRTSWGYCSKRELWRMREAKGKMMAEMPLIRGIFSDYARVTAVLQTFVRVTREQVAHAIRTQDFPADLVEATCMCKFLGTGFAVDCMSAVRKTLGAQALLANSMMGAESFLPNATSAAEGDNTIMELKIVQDIVRGRTPKLPFGLMWRVSGTSSGRTAAAVYVERFARAMFLQKRAMEDGQLLRDIAWARAHLRVIDVWIKENRDNAERLDWLESYSHVLLRFPVPVQA